MLVTFAVKQLTFYIQLGIKVMCISGVTTKYKE